MLGRRRSWLLFVAIAALACIGPDERRPGLWLSGETEPTPSDWSFSNEHREIAVEVQTPYGLRHSVTVWCAELDGALYLGARNPEQKSWPAWADRWPDVRLGIAGSIYDVRLRPLADAELIARLRSAYAAKYQLSAPADGAAPPPIRYWRVEGRG